MKMNKPFEIEDHFKGNFTKEKECPVVQNAFDYINGVEAGEIEIEGDTDYWPGKASASFDYYKPKPITSETLKDMQKDPDLDKFFGQDLGSIEVTNPGKMAIIKGFVEDCSHEPIDVGFATPKMVCKKCDKDL